MNNLTRLTCAAFLALALASTLTACHTGTGPAYPGQGTGDGGPADKGCSTSGTNSLNPCTSGPARP